MASSTAALVALCLTVLLAGCVSEAPPEPPSRSDAKLSPGSDSAKPSSDGDSATPSGSNSSNASESSTHGGAQAVLASGLNSYDDEARAPTAGAQGRVHQMSIRPALTPEARRAFRGSVAPRLRRSTDGLERYQVGTLGEAVSTRNRFQHVVVQVRDAEGNLRTECLENERQLNALLRVRPEQ